MKYKIVKDKEYQKKIEALFPIAERYCRWRGWGISKKTGKDSKHVKLDNFTNVVHKLAIKKV